MQYQQQEVVALFSTLLVFIQQSEAVPNSASILEQQDAQIQRTLFYALIPVVVAFSFIVFIFYRAKRESHFKQKEAELKLSISEMEMKALRAQINPHFIFNCLNSIHHYMHGHDISKASEYLIKFSRLIRQILETSAYRVIPLTDDLQALRLYLELEQLRTNHSFDFEIVLQDGIDPDVIHIPPLLIQPFVENSIWHGVNQKGKGGRIRLDIKRDDRMLICILEDNGQQDGVKQHYDLSNTVKKTSMGMALIQERLKVVNQRHQTDAKFTVVDLFNEKNELTGKRVTLLLPFED